MKLKVDFDGEEFLLDIQTANGSSDYMLTGAWSRSGRASLVPTSPGVFSILLGNTSHTIAITQRNSGLEVWAAGRRHILAITDPRDRSGPSSRGSAAGPVEIRAQMPGKVIKVLVEHGANVESGQGVIIVEAMKMQNEMKSPKTGVIQKIHTVEGATVAAGEALMVIE